MDGPDHKSLTTAALARVIGIGGEGLMRTLRDIDPRLLKAWRRECERLIAGSEPQTQQEEDGDVFLRGLFSVTKMRSK